MTKSILREKYKKLRKEIDKNNLEDLSLRIANQLLNLDIWDKTYYHLFLQIETQNEINTEYILHIIQGKDKEIVVSKSDFETRQMTHYLLTDSTKIIKNIYNIPEPTNGLEVNESKIDVVFVPLLAYDLQGNRVGYGKGFYDTFLSKCKPETIKIGLSFFEPESKIDDVLPTDIQLDYCITPNKIFAF
jgi:5-formyltetrahydrofolate cyclo-ligase